MTFPLLVGTDGVEKMSKSLGNYVGITEPPEEMFGKVMSIPDSALEGYWRLCLDAEPPDAEPMESKLALARGIVETYYDSDAAERAEAHFTRVVREGQAPEDVLEVEHHEAVVYLPQILAEVFGESSSHWRRVIDQQGVKADGSIVTGYELSTKELAGKVIQAGKRRFMRIREA
jgi:tyrosyl-tRNA synthetase